MLKFVEVVSTLCSIGILVLIFILPHGVIENGKLYLYNSSAADYYQRNSTWDTWWTIYSSFAGVLSSFICVLIVADIKNNEHTPLKIMCASSSVLLHLVSMTCMPLVHEMQHTSIIDSASSAYEVHTKIGIGLYVQLALPFLSYAKHLLL